MEQPVVAPRKRRVYDDALGHPGGVIATVERKIGARRTDAVAEMHVAPDDRAHDHRRVRIEQQLVMVEAVAARRIVRSINAVAVEQTGPRVGQVAVPDRIGVFRERDALDFAPSAGIEKAQIDLFGVLRKQREVYAGAVPSGSQRIGSTR